MPDPVLHRQTSSSVPQGPETVNGERVFSDAILQTSLQGIMYIDLQGIVRRLNDLGARLLGIQAHDLLGRSFWSLFPDEALGFSLREALRFGLSYRPLCKTIEKRELEIATTFLSRGPNSSHGLLVMMRDLTELQRLQQMANRNDLMRELGQMAASIAHEIRNSLGGIRGWAALLLRDLAPQPSLAEIAGTIVEGAKSLESLVMALLQYARPMKLHLQSVELGAFLKELSKSIRIDPAYPSNIRLEVHIPQDILLAPIDPPLLKSCLLNLIYNAFQAMPHGGVATLSLLKQENVYQIAVSDTGIGIDSAHFDQLFSPFFTTKQKGTGLGLVEARKIAQAHGGLLEVRSQPGHGATFTLTLPHRRCV